MQGRVVCGLCGSRMSVRYHRRGALLVPDYLCNRGYMEDGARTCQIIPGARIDAAVGDLLIQAMTPMAIEVALAVEQEMKMRLQEADDLRRQQLDRARYEAGCARERYMLVDPSNRLVAQSLEADWNEKLRALAASQDSYERQRRIDEHDLEQSRHKQLFSLVKDFPAIWKDPATPDRERKRMAALLIEDVTLTKSQEITAHVRFRGGAITTLQLPLPMNAWQILKTPDHVLAQIDALLEHHTDSETVAILNTHGIQNRRLTRHKWLKPEPPRFTDSQPCPDRGVPESASARGEGDGGDVPDVPPISLSSLSPPRGPRSCLRQLDPIRNRGNFGDVFRPRAPSSQNNCLSFTSDFFDS